MQPVFVDDRLDPGQFGDLMDQGVGVLAGRGWPQRRQDAGLQSVDERSFSGGTRARKPWRWPGCPPRFRREGGVGGLRFRPIGSDEGGLEELVELSWSRASRSRTRGSNSAIRSSGAISRRPGGRPGRPGHGVPEGFRDRRLLAHTTVIRTDCTNGSGCERLRQRVTSLIKYPSNCLRSVWSVVGACQTLVRS